MRSFPRLDDGHHAGSESRRAGQGHVRVLADEPQPAEQPFLLEAWDVRVLVER
jgi:hypothetical protein